MNDLFLDELELQKCELYRAFLKLPAGQYPDNYLKKKFNELTVAKTQTLLTGIQADLEHLEAPTRAFFDQEFVRVTDDLPQLAVYHQYLLAQALPTKVFQSLLLNPRGTVKDFCTENYFSRATVFRKLQSLQAILEPFHLEFNVSQLQLGGSEIMIRYFLINVLWALSPHFLDDYDLPWGVELDDVVEDVVNVFDERTTYGTREKLRFCLKIIALRQQAGFFAERDVDLNQLPVKRGIVLRHTATWQRALREVPAEKKQAEENCFYFLVFSGPIYISVLTDSYQMFLGWAAQDLPVQKIIHKFGEQIIRDFFHNQKPAYFDIILANIMSVFNTSVILEETPPLIFMMVGDQNVPDNPIYAKLEETSQAFLTTIARRKNFAWLANSVPSLARNFAYCLWPTLEAYLQQKTLRVSLLIDANFNFTLPLLSFINRLNFIEVMPYEAETAEAIDLLICGHQQLVPLDYHGEIFIYTNMAVSDHFANLYQVLNRLQEDAYLKAYHVI